MSSPFLSVRKRALSVRILGTAFVFTVALVAVAAPATIASAAGRPEPPPEWLEIAIVVPLLLVEVLFISVVAVGAYRRHHR